LANSGGEVTNSVATVYRNYAITVIVGVVITVVFVLLFTISSHSNFELAFTCLEPIIKTFCTASSTDIPLKSSQPRFEAPVLEYHFFSNRLADLRKPIVAIQAGASNPKAPIYVSRGLFIAAFFSMLLLPIERLGASEHCRKLV